MNTQKTTLIVVILGLLAGGLWCLPGQKRPSSAGDASPPDQSSESAGPAKSTVSGKTMADLPEIERNSIAEQIHEAERWFTAHDAQMGCGEGFAAPNPGQQISIHADGDGFAVKPWFGEWAVKFSAAGAFETLKPAAEKSELSWHRGGGVREWLRNDCRGVEHGFTLDHDDDPAAPRRISARVETELSVEALPQADGLIFRNADGHAVLRYDHALAMDAKKRPLPITILWAGNGRFDFLVDDAQAEYPVVIDPLISTPGVELFDGLPAINPDFGRTLAMDGGFLAVGYDVDVQGLSQVYLFEQKDDGRWVLVTKLQASDGLLAGVFGSSLSMQSGRLAVGASGYAPAGWPVGADTLGCVYIFERQTDGAWLQVARLTATDPNTSLRVGASVSLSGNYLAAGTTDRFPDSKEAAYVFERQANGTWTQAARLVASDWNSGDRFGNEVALQGALLAVSSSGDNHSGFSGAGSVYLFERNPIGGSWEQKSKLIANDAGAQNYFGNQLVLYGARLAITASYGADAATYRGAVYVFEKPLNGVWSQLAKIIPPDSADSDAFGRALSLDGVSLAVGSGIHFNTVNPGRVYLFDRGPGGTTWNLREQLECFDPLHSDGFGYSIVLRGDILAIGSLGYVGGNNVDGRVSLFARAKGEMSLVRSVGDTPLEAGVERIGLGQSVAVFGDLLVAGAPYTNNQSRGGAGVGAAYLFERHKDEPSSWTLKKSLLGSDTVAGYHFGSSVALNQDAIVVGAPDAGGAGAAYLFLRDQGGPGNWGQAKKLSTAVAGGKLGTSVGIETDVVAVGAPNEDSLRGKVRIFQRDFGGVGNWGLIKTIDDPFAGANPDKFGSALCMDANRLLVGAPGTTVTTGNGPEANGGRAYLFEKNSGGGFNYGLQDTMPQLLPGLGYSGRGGGLFGASVALDGDMALIGEPGEPSPNLGAGRAYIFERNTGSVDAWDQVRELPPPLAQGTVSFGKAVALRRGIAVVSTDNELVCLYTQNFGGPDHWGYSSHLKNRQGGADADKFGAAVSFDGEILAVGEPGSLEYNGTGAVRLYERKFDTWSALKQVAGSDTDQDDTFGASVAIRDGWLLVGAPGQANLTGAAYLFRRNAGGMENWGALKKIGATDAAAGDLFGQAVALDGQTALVGAPNKTKIENVAGVPTDRLKSGAAYFFSRNQNGTDAWGQVVKVSSTVLGAGAANDFFGASVAIDGALAAVGMPADGLDKGRAYLYAVLGNGAWGLAGNLQPANVLEGDLFGSAVAVSGETAIVGAPGDEVAGIGLSAGSAYLFKRDSGGNYGQIGMLNAPAGLLGGKFGSAVALDGDIGAVGAPGDSANGANSGASYAIVRGVDGTWSVTTILRSLTPSAGARFGGSLALQGSTLVISAMGASGSTGAVHVFERGSRTAWHEMQVLSSPDAEALELFGSSVAIDGHILAVGSQKDDDAGANAGSVSLFRLQSRPFDAWRRVWFGDAVVNDPSKEATHWGDAADPDADGMSNVEEAYFGTVPTQYETPRPPTYFMESGTGFLVVRWQRDNVVDRGILARPQYSTDLKYWYTDNSDPDFPHTLEFHDLGGPALGTVEARLHGADLPRAFVRLEIWRE